MAEALTIDIIMIGAVTLAGVQVRNQGMSGAFQGSSFGRPPTTIERQGDLIFKVTLITRRASHTAHPEQWKPSSIFHCAYYHVSQERFPGGDLP